MNHGNRARLRTLRRLAITNSRPQTVVLLHGLWFSGYILFVLARRLRRQGFTVHAFSYPSVRADLGTNAERLADFLDTLDADTVHLVGHSLGGILIRALFHHHPRQKPGRIVTLGTPHGGSRVARHLSRHAFWCWAMGKGVAQLLDADTVHLVGHSFGGILIRALFHYSPPRQAGRIVTLGTPHGGSRVARHLSRHALWRRLMGSGVAQLLAGTPQEWSSPPRDIGVICGTRSFGLGRLLYSGLPRPNDGLLTVKESAFPAAREHLALPVSHTGMLFSREVADQVESFLVSGGFLR